MKTVITEATEKDLLGYFSIAKEYADSLPNKYKVDPKIYAKTVIECLSDQEHTIFLCKRGEDVLGFLVVSVVTNYLSGEKWSIEKVLYVRPEYRSGPSGIRLIKKFEEWSKEQGCASAILNSVEGVTPLNLYYRLGYETIERVHRKEL